MPGLSQARLEYQVETLVTNGMQPQAQAVIAGVGYDPAGLQGGAALLTAMRQNRARRQELLAERKKATIAERQACGAANQKVVSLSETARTLFGNDATVLTTLGLQTRYRMVETEDGAGQVRRAVRLSRSTAERLKRWRLLVDNAQALDEELAAMLGAAGWPAERLAAAGELVQAYATADIAQQAAVQAYQIASTQFKTSLEALRVWYSLASRLIKIAIRDLDPAGQDQLWELLGWTGSPTG